MKIYAVIISYNPDIPLLSREYDSIIPQVDKIVYVDNCSINKSEIHNWAMSKEKVCLINNDSNLGIGAAQNVGIKFALSEDVTHIILFDQDSVVESNFVDNLYKAESMAITEGLNVGLTGPIYRGYDGFEYPICSIENNKFVRKSLDSFANYCKVSHIIASGSLIKREVFEKIGLLREEWFIGYIDFEYCFRAAKYGFVSIVTKKACMQHQMGDRQIFLCGRKIGIYSPFRRYFDCRNTLLIQKEKIFPKALRRHYLKLVFGKFGISLICGPKRLQQFRFCLRGFYDGLRGRVGKCSLVK